MRQVCIRRWILLLTISFWGGSSANASFEQAWEVLYGDSTLTEFHDVKPTPDGGWIVAGSTSSAILNTANGLIARYDENGSEIWSWTYGAAFDDKLYEIVATPDGGWLAAGLTDLDGAGNTEGWTICIDSIGALLWSQTYGTAGEDAFYSISPYEDGWVLACFKTIGGIGSTDGWIIKIDANGGTIWERTLGDQWSDKINDVTVSSSGEIFAVGYSEPSSSTNSSGWIIKLDGAGSILWDRTYLPTYGSKLEAIEHLPTGESVASGTTSGHPWILKIDQSGNQVWSRQQSYTGNLNALIRAYDGGWYSVGSRPYYGNPYGLILRVDSLGNNPLPYSGFGSCEWYGIATAIDGGLVPAGVQLNPSDSSSLGRLTRYRTDGPPNLTSTSGDNQIYLQWVHTRITPSIYQIYRRDGNSQFNLLAVIEGNSSTLSYVDYAVSTGVTYSYKINSKLGNQPESSFSNVVYGIPALVVPRDFPTIQSALDSVAQGGTVLVEPGVYSEHLQWPTTANVILRSSSGAENTIIDGGGTGRVITFDPPVGAFGSNTIIQGFTITNGHDNSQGGGIYMNNAFPQFVELIITGNSSDGNGGGIYLQNSNPSISNTTIENNTCTNYGGGIYMNSSQPILNQVNLNSNTAGERGGGAYVLSSSVEQLWDNCSITNNAANDGAGMFIHNSFSTITGSVISENTAAFSGGGLNISYNSALQLSQTLIERNSASLGAGLYLYNSDPEVHNTIISENSASSGGGIYIYSADPNIQYCSIENNTATAAGGGLYVADQARPGLDKSIVKGNSAGTNGGGVYIFNGSDPNITNSSILINSANSGGGVYFNGCSAYISSTTIFNNNAALYGGGIFLGNDANPNMSRVNIDANHASFGGGVYLNGSQFTANSVTVYKNSAVNDGGGIYLNYSSPSLLNMTIAENTALSSGDGVFTTLGTPSFSACNFISNGEGLFNTSDDETITAASSFWGSATGPYHAIQNAQGGGDSVSTSTTIIPWLMEPDIDAPIPPVQDLLVSQTLTNGIELSWSHSLIPDLSRYRIYWRPDSTRPFIYPDSLNIPINQTSAVLTNIPAGVLYQFTVVAIDQNTNKGWFCTEVGAGIDLVPARHENVVLSSYRLSDNYPNPFNPNTTIPYAIPEQGIVRLIIFNQLGQPIRTLVNREESAGYKSVMWDARDNTGRQVSTGIYFYRIEVNGFSQTRKMVLLK